MANRAKTIEHKAEVITRLSVLWLKHPELRLAQLIGNVYPCGPDTGGHIDPYHVEDYEFVKELEKFYGK